MIKAILLDFDGTLVESVGIKDEAFRALFSDQPQYFDDIWHYHLSHNATIRFEKFKHITENILKQSYTKEQEVKLCQAFSSQIVDKIIQCPAVKGAIEFLEDFYRRMPLYLISVSPQDELQKVLDVRGLTKYFKKIYATTESKENLIYHLLQQENLSSKEMIFISDTPEDYQAAQKVGVPFIGRQSGKFPADFAAPIFQDFIEIDKILAQKMRLYEEEY